MQYFHEKRHFLKVPKILLISELPPKLSGTVDIEYQIMDLLAGLMGQPLFGQTGTVVNRIILGELKIV